MRSLTRIGERSGGQECTLECRSRWITGQLRRGRCAQVEPALGNSRKAANIKAPEEHAAQPRGNARSKLRGKLGPLAQLVPRPVHGTRLRPRVVGAAEGKSLVHAVLGQDRMIGADILPGVEIVRFQPLCPAAFGVVVEQELLPSVLKPSTPMSSRYLRLSNHHTAWGWVKSNRRL